MSSFCQFYIYVCILREVRRKEKYIYESAISSKHTYSKHFYLFRKSTQHSLDADV